MPEISLYKICLKRVCSLLEIETWKHCSVNPFADLPSRIVDDVYINGNLEKCLPVLLSGSLTRLYLRKQNVQEERNLLLQIIRTNCVKFLRYFDWFSLYNSNIPLVETLIRSLPKLEEFIATQIINLDAFENCKELRALRMYKIVKTNNDFSDINFSALASLRHLQTVCISASMESDNIAKLLKYCPQLISLGNRDSLEGLEKIHAKIKRRCETDYTEVSDHFQLKRCVWGDPDSLDSSYESSFSEKIRIAVSLCPFVEELEICVFHPNSIEYLKNLKRLTCLKISFLECDRNRDCMANFIALIGITGSKLKYLSVNSTDPVPVDIICDCCPQLESLEIMDIATASGFVQPHCNVFLKKLDIKMIDQNALLFLLASCRGLEELDIYEALCLDDSLLSEILTHNPLAQLKGCKISKCNLSKKGFRMILQKVSSLEGVYFNGNAESIVKNLINELNLTNLIYDICCVRSDRFGYDF